MIYRKTSQFRINSLLGLLLLVAFFIALFFILRGLLILLIYAAPFLLIAAFFIDRSVIINHVKMLGSKLKANPLAGAGLIALTLLGYMVVFPYLFLMAVLNRKIKDNHKRHEREQQGEFTDFEEVESKSGKRGDGVRVIHLPGKE